MCTNDDAQNRKILQETLRVLVKNRAELHIFIIDEFKIIQYVPGIM